MKYKVKVWKYDIFDCEEAQRKLNEMAQCGYELINISEEWFPLALYQKREDASKKRYEVELLWKDDENFLQMCEDAGWQRQIELKNHQCIFVTTKKNTRPLYSDQASRCEYMKESMQSGCKFDFVFIGFAIFMAILYFMLKWMWNIKEVLYLGIGSGIIVTMYTASYTANYYYTLKVARGMTENVEISKPLWIKVLNRLGRICLVLIPIGFVGLWLYKFICLTPDVIGVVFTLIAPVMFMAGYFLRVFTKQKKLGFLIMYLAVVLLLLMPNIVGLFDVDFTA